MSRYERVLEEPITIRLLLPPSVYEIIETYQERIRPFVEDVNEIESAHLTVKYLGHEMNPKYTDGYMESLIPEIRGIARKYLPIRVQIHGLSIWELRVKGYEGRYVVFLDILPNEELESLHDEIIEKLGDRIDYFELEDENFRPHISLTYSGKSENLRDLERIVKKSKKDPIFTVEANKLVMRLRDDRLVRIL